MEYLLHNAPMNRLFITKIAVTYRKAIVRNLISIISCRFAYLEPVTVSTNHICRIIVPFSLRCIVS